MATIDPSGGTYSLYGDLKIVVPAEAVDDSITVTTTPSDSPNAAQGYRVICTWRIDATEGVALAQIARFQHPLVENYATDAKLRFYARKDDISGGIPCNWMQLGESPLDDESIDGNTGLLPPATTVGAGPHTSFLCIVRIP